MCYSLQTKKQGYSYRKQIARQQSCHKNLGRARGVDVVDIFLSSSLITKRNLVAICHTVYTKNAALGPAPLDRGYAKPSRNAPLPTCYCIRCMYKSELHSVYK